MSEMGHFTREIVSFNKVLNDEQHDILPPSTEGKLKYVAPHYPRSTLRCLVLYPFQNNVPLQSWQRKLMTLSVIFVFFCSLIVIK